MAGGKVLAVDDDEVILRSYARGFAREGWQVIASTHAAAALESARATTPDLVILDLHLPDAWGIDVIKQLHAGRARPRIVVVSGYATVATTMDAIHAGASHVFFKPMAPAHILRALDTSTPTTPPETPSLARAQWEHIWRVYTDSGRNVSLTARRLGIHRQALQRRLRKRIPPR